MKNLLMLSVLITVAFMSSCKKDNNEEDHNDNNNNNQCYDFVNLDSHFEKVYYIDFLDLNNAWLVGTTASYGQVLMNTTDGGANWTVIDDDFQIDQRNLRVPLQFVTATNGIKRVRTASTGKLKLQYTTDKGVTWIAYDNPFIKPDGTYEYITGWSGTFASNETETIMFGHDHSGYNRFVLKVNNSTMAITYSNMIPASNSVHIAYETGNAFHYSANNTITGFAYDKMVQSTDNGNTWVTVSAQIPNAEFQSASWVNDNIGYFQFDGSPDDLIYKTTDSGASWTKINFTGIPSNLSNDIKTIRFASEMKGLFVTDFDLYATEDGGQTWQQLSCKNSNNSDAMAVDEVLAYPSVDNGWIPGTQYDSEGGNGKDGIFHYQD